MRKFRELISSDIPFARDDAHRLLPAMIACLTGFAALLLALALCLTQNVREQSRAVIGTIQVEVPRSKASDTAYLDTLTRRLKETPGVETVTILGQREMEMLLKPWLGNDFTLADLPVPLIVDVTTAVKNQSTTVDMAALRTRLHALDADIHVEVRGPWVAQMLRAGALLQGLVLVVAVLLMLCVLGMIILVARTNLRLHFKTVSLLHMFGATDDYILRQFQWNNAWITARGALAGVGIAALVFASAVVMSAQWDSPAIPEITASALHGVMFAILPVFTAMIALVATRLTVQSMLEHMH
jgi:cell division protein FtsX